MSASCVACAHEIDDAAKICPYCGADPRTGEKPIDTDAILREEFEPRKSHTAADLIDFARQRQGAIVAVGILVGLLVLGLIYNFISQRNDAVSDASAVPITEVTEVTDQGEDNKPLPMPQLQLQYDGHPQTMRAFVTEPGAVTPPEVLAAQQAAAQEAAAQKAAAQQAAPQPGQPGPRPGQPAVPPQPRPVPPPQSRPSAPQTATH